MQETLYTIGEMSKLANVSVKALRYYDKINLFKPAHVDPVSNYRYYKDSQLYHLDFIKSLKYIGTPLEEMKKALELEPHDLLTFIMEQEQLVQKKMDELETIQQNIANVKKRMQRQLETPALGEVFLWEEEATRIIQTKADDLKPKDLLNASYSKLKKIVESTDGFMNTGYGALYSLQPYNDIDDITYDYLFTPMLTTKNIALLPPDLEITTIPAGTYVCIADVFSPEQYIHNLHQLIQYIDKHQLEVISDVYEIFMPLRYSPNHQEEYMIELKVHVK